MGKRTRHVAHLAEFTIDAGAGVENYGDACRRSRGIKGCYRLLGAILENAEIIAREPAHVRAIRPGNRARHRNERDTGTYHGNFTPRPRHLISSAGMELSAGRVTHH